MMSASVAGRLPARSGVRLPRPLGSERRWPMGGLALSAAGHALLAAVIGLGLMWGVGARPKTYVVNLVPSVAAVGTPTAPPAKSAPAPRPAPLPPRPPDTRRPAPPPDPLPPRPLPARESARLPEPALPARSLPPRVGTVRPGDKEMPPLAQPSARPGAEPRMDRPAPAEPPRPPAPQVAVGQRTGSPVGTGALTLDASDFPHAWYLRQVLQKVQGEWQRQPPVQEPGQRPLILVEIMRDGSIRVPRVEQTSGSAFYDQAAVRAVVAASPFPPLPQDWSKASLRVMFRFELERG
jgi:protein TonB